jgi:enamine deaminase RidA (YjgF/YER057c/UK114 family)
MPEQTERLRVASGSPFEPLIGFSRAVRAGGRVLVSGTAPIWPDGSCDPDPGVQAARCLEIVVGALAEAGAGPEDVVRTRTYLVDPADWDEPTAPSSPRSGRRRPWWWSRACSTRAGGSRSRPRRSWPTDPLGSALGDSPGSP